MFNVKKRNISALISILLLIIFSSQSIAFSITTNNLLDNKSSYSINAEKICIFNSDYNDIEYVSIASTNNNESKPSMVFNKYNGLISYEYESENETHIYFKNSIDYGLSWSKPTDIEIDVNQNSLDVETESPKISLIPNSNKAYVTFISPYNNSAVVGYIKINDISNINNLESVAFDWSNLSYNETTGEYFSFYNFTDPDIVCYDDIVTEFVVGFTGSTNYKNETTGEGPCNNSPMFFYQYDDDPSDGYYDIMIAWYPDFENCRNLVLDSEYGSSTVYGVCELENGSKEDLLFFHGNPDIWSNDSMSLPNSTISFTESLYNPDIFVKNNVIYVVAETCDNEIVLFVSYDNGDNWTNYQVYESESIFTYPKLFVNNTHISCIFIDSENLFFTYSNNSGITWSEPLQVNDQNDSVVSCKNSISIGDSNHMSWTDNRTDANTDIYSIVKNIPESDIVIVDNSIKLSGELSFLKTNNWIEFKAKNNGDGRITDVQILVSYKCENETATYTEYDGYMSELEGFGAEKTFRVPLFRLRGFEFISSLIDFAGITEITISLKTDDDVIQDSETKFDISYEDIFPKLARFEDLFLKL